MTIYYSCGEVYTIFGFGLSPPCGNFRTPLESPVAPWKLLDYLRGFLKFSMYLPQIEFSRDHHWKNNLTHQVVNLVIKPEFGFPVSQGKTK